MEEKVIAGDEEEKEIVRCVMCNNPAEYVAKAKYKDGIKDEPLCENCARINQQIETEKWRYKT